MSRAARAFLKLPFSEKKAVVLMLVLIPIVELLLLGIGFKRTASLVWKPNMGASLSENDIDRMLTRYARLMKKVNRVLPYGRCLAQSLVLGRVLQSKGIAVELVFGQSKIDQKLAAHAWLEYAGLPINESQNVARTYIPFRKPVLKT